MNDVMFSSKSCEWETPQELFDNLDAKYHFTLDVCATYDNRKCQYYFSKEEDGLKQDWGKHVVWCNPPYGREIGKWVLKCFQHWQNGGIAVMLLPSRTDTQWFHEFVYGYARIEFIRGRLKFGGSVHNAPFPSMLVFYE